MYDLHKPESASPWQNQPLLGASEQLPDALAKRHRALEQYRQAGSSEVCLISIATGAYNHNASDGAALLRNKQDYCQACGYRCLINTDGAYTTARPHKWDKLLMLHDAMRVCSIVMYVDADVVFRSAFQLPPLTRSWLVGSKDFVGFNTGVLLLVRSAQARTFLPRAWNHSFFNRSFSAEQNAVRLTLRRPFVERRERDDRVTVFENLVSYQLHHSAFGTKVQQDTNFTAPLYHSAGCAASAGIKSIGPMESRMHKCQQMLLHQLPATRPFKTCSDVERRFRVASFAYNRHTQRGGATNLGRRWLTVKDLRIRYTDQKGTYKSGQWWLQHPGCAMYGCGEPSKKKKKKKKSVTIRMNMTMPPSGRLLSS